MAIDISWHDLGMLLINNKVCLQHVVPDLVTTARLAQRGLIYFADC